MQSVSVVGEGEGEQSCQLTLIKIVCLTFTFDISAGSHAFRIFATINCTI